MHASVVSDERMGRTGWAVATGLNLFVLALATVPPFVPELWRAVLMMAFDPVCHQMPDRSFLVHGEQFAVCHRCYGTFAGMLLGSAVLPLARRWDAALYRHTGIVFLIALGIPGTDWLGGIAGIWSNTALSRSLTGAVFGLAAGYYFARALSQAFTSRPAGTETSGEIAG